MHRRRDLRIASLVEPAMRRDCCDGPNSGAELADRSGVHARIRASLTIVGHDVR